MAVQRRSHQKLVDGYCIWDIVVTVPHADRHSCPDLVTMEICFAEGFFPPNDHTGNLVLYSAYRDKGESPCRMVMLMLK